MISYNEALSIILQNKANFGVEKIATQKAFGKILAQDIFSRINVPSFDNSAMDGFALRSEDTKKASKDNPIKIKILQTIEAGDNIGVLNSDEFIGYEIMTGAVLPYNFDCVLMAEKAEILTEENGDRYLKITSPIDEKTNVRAVGEDFKIDEKIISVGEKITANHIMALCATGNYEVVVKKNPQIAIIATGKEITDFYSDELKIGQIYNSNSPYLARSLEAKGYQNNYYGINSDDENNFCKMMDKIIEDGSKIIMRPSQNRFCKKILGILLFLRRSVLDIHEERKNKITKNFEAKGRFCDGLIISTGAVSMGKKDFIKETLQEIGFEILFHKVAIKPGKPILFARNKNIFFFGLPGNPISTAVGLEFFVLPFIENSLETKAREPLFAELENDLKIKSGLKHFLKSFAYFEKNKLKVKILDGQESFKIKPFTQSNSFAIIDENNSEVKKGDLVKIKYF
jgi:molybdopterin molybdotransferase